MTPSAGYGTRRGEYTSAVSELKQAEALAPSNPQIAAHLGFAYAKAGHKQEAVTELKRALASGSAVADRPELEHMVAELSANPSAASRVRSP